MGLNLRMYIVFGNTCVVLYYTVLNCAVLIILYYTT